MSSKTVPFTIEKLREITGKYPTPFHIYDEAAILDNAKNLLQAFSWAPVFKEYFAVKACPNPHIIHMLMGLGFGTDCSSMAELVMSEKTGVTGENIMFTSNDTPAEEFKKARELGAIINLDDITHIEFLEQNAGLPDLLSFRYNPGPLREGNHIIGHPEEAKYGFTRDQLFEGYRLAQQKGVKRFGLHTMIASNELDPDYFVETAQMLFELAVEILNETGVRLEFVNLGGGFGIPYRPEEKSIDMAYVGEGIRKEYEKYIKGTGLDPLSIYMESGRMITGPYGYLVSTVLHKKETYKNYIGLDSSMANLMRPGIYGAYHHVTIMEREGNEKTFDVTGSLCENNDKFAIDRVLPEPEVGDLVVIHDTGAHGYAMGFNYNGKLRSAELLLRVDGTVKEIRRAETLDDYFSTLDFAEF